jgi:hypothetical protein
MTVHSGVSGTDHLGKTDRTGGWWPLMLGVES